MKKKNELLKIYLLDIENRNFSKTEKYISEIRNEERDFDINELIKLFEISSEVSILNELSLLFRAFKIDLAAPYLFDKINEPKYVGKYGTWVYALVGLNFNYNIFIIDIVKITLTGTFEAREMAEKLIENSIEKLSNSKRMEALKLLGETPISNSDDDKYKRSNYVEYAIELLSS